MLLGIGKLKFFVVVIIDKILQYCIIVKKP